MDKKEVLLSPIKIGSHVSPNRFFAQAMECTDADADGNPSDLTYERYENLFKGEIGLVSLEAITITDKNRSRLNQLFIMPKNQPALTTFVSKLKAINPKTVFIFQLTHSGELSNPQFSKRLSVKPLPGFTADVFTEDEFEKIMADFVLAAKIAYDAGADGIDMKFCHGYLGSQILRPYNTRKWKYGGPWENRRQFAFDLYERIQKAVPDKNFLIGSKISVWEGFPGGFGTAGPDTPMIDLTEPIDLVKGLEERGAQYFIQSAGSPSITISLTQADKERPYFAYLHQYFAKALRDNLNKETVVIGSNYSVFGKGKNKLQAVTEEESSLLTYGAQNIEKGYVDMIGLGRQSFADPMLPLKLREGRESEIKYCTACDNCLELLIQQSPIGCCTYNKYYTEVLVNTRKEKGRLAVDHT
ncbi:MAG: 2,4-dienoyl-CoA reductase [Chloroflexi bacterium HGW-Chloroflexi-5]|jgi:2,4-dienoyl-CoA reductase-like NADH-dependent reductase (Old Yellow Enzyme family)|nr:MAG: 2,4-dienoyl-CoA reductase [Chloroflexi bacterium HGW-Chloroflexi-5]